MNTQATDRRQHPPLLAVEGLQRWRGGGSGSGPGGGSVKEAAAAAPLLPSSGRYIHGGSSSSQSPRAGPARRASGGPPPTSAPWGAPARTFGTRRHRPPRPLIWHVAHWPPRPRIGGGMNGGDRSPRAGGEGGGRCRHRGHVAAGWPPQSEAGGLTLGGRPPTAASSSGAGARARRCPDCQTFPPTAADGGRGARWYVVACIPTLRRTTAGAIGGMLCGRAPVGGGHGNVTVMGAGPIGAAGPDWDGEPSTYESRGAASSRRLVPCPFFL